MQILAQFAVKMERKKTKSISAPTRRLRKIRKRDKNSLESRKHGDFYCKSMLTRPSRTGGRESIQIHGAIVRPLGVNHQTRFSPTATTDFQPKHSLQSYFSLFSMGWRFKIAFLWPRVALSVSLHYHRTYPMLANQVKGDSYEKSTRKYFNLDSIARIMFATNFSYFLRIFFEVLCSVSFVRFWIFQITRGISNKTGFLCAERLNEFLNDIIAGD